MKIVPRKLWILATAGLALAAAAGCRAPQTAGMEAGGTISATPEGDTQMTKFVVINNQKLARGLQVVDARHTFANDILHASITIVAKGSRDLQFQYKFAWFNANGMEVEADRYPWTPVVVHGFESKTLQAVAPNPSVREFRLKIRPL
ncbi:MAG: YcfL family protein [Lentisphaeria bacterium]